MVITLADWQFCVDVQATLNYTNQCSLDHCTCPYCQNFYENMDRAEPALRPVLSKFGIFLNGPCEVMPLEHDLILAASVLEHLDSRASAIHKLTEIQQGIRPGGGVLIVMNTGVREWDAMTGEAMEPQFEVNLPPEEVRWLLSDTFRGWEVLWDKCIHYEYEIPRGDRTAVVSAEVVTFTARRLQ